MRNVGRAFAAELRKLTTTRLWWVLAIIMVGYLGLVSAGFAAVFALAASGDAATAAQLPGAGASQAAALLPYSFASSTGYVFVLVFTVMTVTQEWRHATLGPTFLQIPRRGTVLAAKLATGAVAGAAGAVLALLASIGAGALVLLSTGGDPRLGDPEVWSYAGRTVLALALWGVIGIGVGTLMRNQIAAIVTVLAFTQFVQPLLRVAGGFWEPAAVVVDYLPGSASDALSGLSIYSVLGGMPGLSWWLGAVVLAIYAVVFAALGAALSWRRDVTN